MAFCRFPSLSCFSIILYPVVLPTFVSLLLGIWGKNNLHNWSQGPRTLLEVNIATASLVFNIIFFQNNSKATLSKEHGISDILQVAWTMHTWGKLATEEPWKWNNMDTTFLIMTVFAYFSMKSNSIWNCNWKNWIKYNIQLNWFVLQCCSKGNIWDVEYRIYIIMGITTWTSHALTGWRGCTGIVLGINTW